MKASKIVTRQNVITRPYISNGGAKVISMNRNYGDVIFDFSIFTYAQVKVKESNNQNIVKRYIIML